MTCEKCGNESATGLCVVCRRAVSEWAGKRDKACHDALLDGSAMVKVTPNGVLVASWGCYHDALGLRSVRRG